MPLYVFIWLLVVIALVVSLALIRHSRKVATQIEMGLARARGVVDRCSEGIVSMDTSGVIDRFNLAAESIFGFTEAGLIGESFLTLFPRQMQEECAGILESAAADAGSAGTQHYEIVARRASGDVFPLAVNVALVNDEGTTRIQVMCRDISARRLAELSNAKSQKTMTFLLQTSPVVFYTCDPNGSLPIIFVSPNVEKIFGYKPEAITGASAFWPRHIHPDDIERVHISRAQVSKEYHDELEYRLKMPDGSYRWISDHRETIRDDEGRPSLMVGCWSDIHNRKVAEESLAEKQEHLRISLRCSGLMTWEWHINSGEITWFGNVSQALGIEADQLANFSGFSEIAHPEDADNLQEAFKRSLIHDENLDHECRVICPDKRILWIHLAGELINDEAGSPVKMAGILSDITEEKQLHVATPIMQKMAG